MFTLILSFIHNLTTLMFGIFISAFFLGIRQNSKNILTLSLFFGVEGVLTLTSFLLLGEEMTYQLYPLIIHLPLVIFLVRYYKYSVISSCISVASAYLCCQLSNWIGLLALSFTNAQWCYYVSRIFTTVLSFFLLCKFVCRTTEIIFAKNDRELYIIGFLPTIYYVFDYAFTKFSDLLYSGNRAIAEFMGFIFCIAYLAFVFIYFREYEKRLEIRQYSNLMEMQLLSIQREADYVKQSMHKLSILKHDMRHHLNIIRTQLQNKNTEQAIEYIQKIDNAYDEAVIITYCQNEMINSVISIYQTRLADKNIALKCNISIGSAPLCPDTAVCMILSNALENAMHALEAMDMEEKWVSLSMSQRKNRFLLQIENPILETPKLVDGIPVSDREGHGFGIKSILYYVEQIKGQCQFSVSDSSFLMRIII